MCTTTCSALVHAAHAISRPDVSFALGPSRLPLLFERVLFSFICSAAHACCAGRCCARLRSRLSSSPRAARAQVRTATTRSSSRAFAAMGSSSSAAARARRGRRAARRDVRAPASDARPGARLAALPQHASRRAAPQRRGRSGPAARAAPRPPSASGARCTPRSFRRPSTRPSSSTRRDRSLPRRARPRTPTRRVRPCELVDVRRASGRLARDGAGDGVQTPTRTRACAAAARRAWTPRSTGFVDDGVACYDHRTTRTTRRRAATPR